MNAIDLLAYYIAAYGCEHTSKSIDSIPCEDWRRQLQVFPSYQTRKKNIPSGCENFIDLLSEICQENDVES